mgnify:CR=1 FL=1
MAEHIDIETAITGLMIATPRLIRILAWNIFALVHLTLGVVGLFALWWFQIAPADIQALAVPLLRLLPLSTIGQIAAFLGLSGLALVWGYTKAWRWFLRKRLAAFSLGPWRQ